MSKPRFKVGQVVVVTKASNSPYIGHIGVVQSVVKGFSESHIGSYLGRHYRISGTPENHYAPEPHIRPYDPPASWDDEDMVWKPDALREPEKEST